VTISFRFQKKSLDCSKWYFGMCIRNSRRRDWRYNMMSVYWCRHDTSMTSIYRWV